MNKPKILIVGAGPTGLTAAVELARHGIIADIIDKRDAASTWSRAVGILPSSQRLLEPSGVTAKLLQAGIHVRGINAYYKGRKTMSAPFNTEQPTLIALPQDETETILRESFEEYGGRVTYSFELTSLSQTENSVLVEFDNDDQTSYDYVIGADGINSKVRESQNISFDGFVVPDEWSIADIELEDWENPDRFSIFINDDGIVAIVVPIGTDRYRVIANRPDALKRLPIPINITKIRREGNFHISVKQAASYQKGRVFLAGDSAHCHSPVGGRGMNLGMADAVDLARRFAQNDLTDYSTVRHAAGKEILELTERGRKIVSSKNPFLKGAIRMAFTVIDKSRSLQKRVTNLILDA